MIIPNKEELITQQEGKTNIYLMCMISSVFNVHKSTFTNYIRDSN